jgi:hypothetical protein
MESHASIRLLLGLLVGGFFFLTSVFSQDLDGNLSATDSLKHLLHQTQEDTTRLRLYYELTTAYNNVNPHVSMQYAS